MCTSMGQAGAAGVTPAQSAALEYYASGDGMYLNNMLRGRAGVDERDLNDSDRQIIKDMDEALNKDLGEQTLYRSVDASAIFGNDVDLYDLLGEIRDQRFSNARGEYSQNKARELQKVIDGTVGKTYTDKGYVSTTRDRTIAEDWQGFSGSENPVVMVINTSKGTKGANISNVSDYMKQIEADSPQKETLLARNQKYKIKKVYANNGTVYVDVDM